MRSRCERQRILVQVKKTLSGVVEPMKMMNYTICELLLLIFWRVVLKWSSSDGRTELVIKHFLCEAYVQWLVSWSSPPYVCKLFGGVTVRNRSGEFLLPVRGKNKKKSSRKKNLEMTSYFRVIPDNLSFQLQILHMRVYFWLSRVCIFYLLLWLCAVSIKNSIVSIKRRNRCDVRENYNKARVCLSISVCENGFKFAIR